MQPGLECVTGARRGVGAVHRRLELKAKMTLQLKIGPLMTLLKPLALIFLLVSIPYSLAGQTPAPVPVPTVFGYADFTAQAKLE